MCSQCQSHNKVTWEGWTTTGAWEIHGIAQEETALGLQLHCDGCKQRHTPSSSTKSGPTLSGNVVVGDESQCYLLAASS